MSKPTLATVWLDGCSGCHMSLIDLDERLLELAAAVDVVYSPLVDLKDYPEHVTIALVEGAISSEEDLYKIYLIRERTDILVAFGDCASAGNVPTMRNPFKVQEVLDHGYIETAEITEGIPADVIPALLPYVRPIQEFVNVDVFMQGCPPSPDVIYYVLTELLAGRKPDLANKTRPGA